MFMIYLHTKFWGSFIYTKLKTKRAFHAGVMLLLLYNLHTHTTKFSYLYKIIKHILINGIGTSQVFMDLTLRFSWQVNSMRRECVSCNCMMLVRSFVRTRHLLKHCVREWYGYSTSWGYYSKSACFIIKWEMWTTETHFYTYTCEINSGWCDGIV